LSAWTWAWLSAAPSNWSITSPLIPLRYTALVGKSWADANRMRDAFTRVSLWSGAAIFCSAWGRSLRMPSALSAPVLAEGTAAPTSRPEESRTAAT
jgi:hypothetical protein